MDKKLPHFSAKSKSWTQFFKKRIWADKELYLFLLPALIYLLIFEYWPMYGLIIAFKNYIPTQGFWGSEWVGFAHFERFFDSYMFWTVIKNTLTLSLYQLLASFPFPIILALCLQYAFSEKFKRFVQTVSYAPHFISLVVMVGMLHIFLSPENGILNQLLGLFGMEPIFFMGEASMFKSIYVWSGVWQEIGFASILYLAVLTGVDPTLHEAAIVDGASKVRRVWHIDVPVLIPTAMIMLILGAGRMLSLGFEKVYLMQNSINLQSSEVLSTYVYKTGILGAQFSYTTAIGLFNNLVNLILLLSVNYLAKRYTKQSLF